jgi:hypothetical protein
MLFNNDVSFFLWGELFDVQQAGEDDSQSFASQVSTSQIRLARWIGLSNRKIFDSAAQPFIVVKKL